MAVISCLIRSTHSNSSLFSTSINILSRNFTSLTSETTLHSHPSWNDSSSNNNNKPLTLRTEPKDRNFHWVFLGCPGVGKGTYATRLSKLLNVPHIATGDLVRDELASSGPLSPKIADIVNTGQLVSDEIIVNLLSKRLEAGEAKGESGFILDGFPRTVRQALLNLLHLSAHPTISLQSTVLLPIDVGNLSFISSKTCHLLHFTLHTLLLPTATVDFQLQGNNLGPPKIQGGGLLVVSSTILRVVGMVAIILNGLILQ